MSKVIAVFFSPSETTKKVVSQIANNFDDESVVFLLVILRIIDFFKSRKIRLF